MQYNIFILYHIGLGMRYDVYSFIVSPCCFSITSGGGQDFFDGCTHALTTL